jgi:glycosyltransferase involved in cell wall biosynthesis
MRVVFVTTILTQYRVPFHERVRRTLAAEGIVYDLLYGVPSTNRATRRDTAELSWATKVPTYYPGGTVWQPVLRDLWNCDLAVVTQENKLLVNYVAQSLAFVRPSRLALWGHGRNFQSDPLSVAERWKHLWATKCDWWFTYTKGTKAGIERYGFPPERITVFQNAIDTTELGATMASISKAELEVIRRELDLGAGPIGLFIGGLHVHKRLEFLLDAAARVASTLPGFRCLVVGDGPGAAQIREARSRHAWLRATGALFGRDKAKLLKLADAYLMPGLVGLGILDAMAAGLPVLTTAYPYHSPEIEYLVPGENGEIVVEWNDAQAYANEVVRILRDEGLRSQLSAGAARMAGTYTIEAMAQNFCSGVRAALAAPKRRR